MRSEKPANLGGLFALSFALAMILGLQSCEQYEILPPPPPEEVTFSEIQDIFNNGCVGCHDGVTANPVLEEGVAYDNLMNGDYIDTANPEQSTLYVKMSDSSHSLYSSGGERNKVLKWIQDGAPNN